MLIMVYFLNQLFLLKLFMIADSHGSVSCVWTGHGLRIEEFASLGKEQYAVITHFYQTYARRVRLWTLFSLLIPDFYTFYVL